MVCGQKQTIERHRLAVHCLRCRVKAQTFISCGRIRCYRLLIALQGGGSSGGDYIRKSKYCRIYLRDHISFSRKVEIMVI